jgi:hypothetical protein
MCTKVHRIPESLELVRTRGFLNLELPVRECVPRSVLITRSSLRNKGCNASRDVHVPTSVNMYEGVFGSRDKLNALVPLPWPLERRLVSCGASAQATARAHDRPWLSRVRGSVPQSLARRSSHLASPLITALRKASTPTCSQQFTDVLLPLRSRSHLFRQSKTPCIPYR